MFPQENDFPVTTRFGQQVFPLSFPRFAPVVQILDQLFSPSRFKCFNREVKHEVYGTRQTAKMKLLLSVFICLYSGIKIFVFAVNNKRHFSIFV